MTNTHCARCRRPSPPEESDDFVYWEALGTDGLAVICPGCITGEEQQAMDEDDMAMDEAMRETRGMATADREMAMVEKVRENRLRRAAERQGLQLIKSRRRDPRAADYGVYWVQDGSTRGRLTNSMGIDLDSVEEFLLGDGAE